MWVSKEIQEDLTGVEFFFLDHRITKIYNDGRKKNQPRVFGGWCWAYRNQEGGPFRTRSAAMINAYYLVVLRRTPPKMYSLGSNIISLPERKIKNG